LRNYRKQQWQPELTARMSWNEFQGELGGKDMRQRANSMARKILSEHHPAAVDEAQARELNRLAAAMQKSALAVH